MSNSNNDQNNLGPTNATSPTTFGQSVESKAQKDDAATTDDTRERLNVYRLEPIAEANDPRWDNSPYQGVVVVAARTSGDARIVASERELDFMEIDAAPAEDVTTSNASAFRSEKLYTVIEIDHARSDLTRGVLEGDISIATIKPVQV
ncbi:hypothetical protein [Pararhizobium qamdonense]|uniref:hypothetical protein n=1 Tax=Pararhizobium qamdonense TaxID=3031126 RepID=UPI0023E144B9|nr:hypothetical protein [Pararhizobium qamdonense]